MTDWSRRSITYDNRQVCHEGNKNGCFILPGGSLQECARASYKSGSVAAIHAMHRIFDPDETDAVLLIDASDAFNALIRAAALHNIRVRCPTALLYN